MTLLAEPAGRLLERTGNRAPRGMTVHDRTRLIGQLHFISEKTEVDYRVMLKKILGV